VAAPRPEAALATKTTMLGTVTYLRVGWHYSTVAGWLVGRRTVGRIHTGDGVRIAYQERGAERPIVLIPGWGASARWFDKQLAGLSDQYRVIAIDPRFHGQSDRPDFGGRISRNAKDILELLEALDLKDVVLVGWSIGTAHMLSFFDLFGSERISGYAIVCGSPKPLNEEGWSNGFADLAQAGGFKAFAAADPVTLANTNVPTYFHTAPSASDLAWMIEDTANLPSSASGVAFDCIVQDYRDTVGRLDRPTLAIYSEHDPVIPVANAEFVRTMLPGARVEVFHNSGHCPFWEEPDRFNQLLRDFAASTKTEAEGSASG
jgi:non-heme chloroperoxidase